MGTTAHPQAVAQDPPESSAARPSRSLEICCAATALAATGALVLLAKGIEVRRETDGIDPRWWPELLGMIGLALAAAYLVVAVVRPPFPRTDLEAATRRGWPLLVATVSLTAAFVALWPLVGFAVAAPVFLSAMTYLVGGRGWRTLLIYPAVVTALVYLPFHTLLKVPL
ncbi:tripartite tricarboxylate transporter TctB family protein [Saccharopolyspora mangrovi]|uniref:Tripartite tricarboxylate transporter TctB family protein n=1 Tax=Saccharopolyspora mangrovi TaxID=3082379 RepID=A0ABU6AET1_9PSEU|nr:tripartite tricarboxylate transporter TctB family protein [Saccharopolyspora sp. S2-29]MEB3370058.1 tripartite tricarboxylate transporter TctB family protein [Saccharopolyspora sp. S2-29]